METFSLCWLETLKTGFLARLDTAHMSLVMRKLVFVVSDTNRAVQPQKMARGLKFLI